MTVEMRGVVKRFGSMTALRDVDLELNPGEIHALLGENGAGKSTLMHVLSGSIRADRGEIRMDGKPVRMDSPRAARRHGVAMVHQHFTLVPAFTVAENLALDAMSMRMGIARVAHAFNYSAGQDALEALARARSLGWEIEPEARIDQLSVGTQQRVEIVKTLATGAKILIFDEPTAVLAASEVAELFNVLRRLRAEGFTVVLIAHKLAEILAVADRVTVLRHGLRVASAPCIEVDARKLAGWMMGEDPSTASVPPDLVPVGTRATRVYPRRSAEVPACQSTPTPSELGAGGMSMPPELGAEGPTPSKFGAESGFTASNIVVLGDRGEQAVRDVSIEVRRGEIFGIGGVDGNGQTELAEALIGLRPLKSGALRWNGGEFRPGEMLATGYIPQDRRRSGLAITMTVEENLILDAAREREYRRGPFLRRRGLRSMAADLVKRFDIRVPGLGFPVSSLSGGNQQKIVVARALRSRPEWIVAVNPTRGLDIGATRFVRDQLRQARDRGAGIVLISTDLDEVAALSDRAAILSGGRLTEYRVEEAHAEEIGLLLGGMPMDASIIDFPGVWGTGANVTGPIGDTEP
jgi:ABC-type uncharacterized transport system ATPase subunit